MKSKSLAHRLLKKRNRNEQLAFKYREHNLAANAAGYAMAVWISTFRDRHNVLVNHPRANSIPSRSLGAIGQVWVLPAVERNRRCINRFSCHSAAMSMFYPIIARQ